MSLACPLLSLEMCWYLEWFRLGETCIAARTPILNEGAEVGDQTPSKTIREMETDYEEYRVDRGNLK
jgi:hypothetical protein